MVITSIYEGTPPAEAVVAFYSASIERGIHHRNEHFMSLLQDAEDALPDMNEATYNALGIASFAGSTNEALSEAFLKEGKHQVSRDAFRVVSTLGGESFLLKSYSNTWFGSIENGSRFPKCDEVAFLRDAQTEVIAYRIAEAVGYRVPETTLVVFEGKPWISYAYKEGAVDFYDTKWDTLLSDPGNPAYEGVLLRPIYNRLADLLGDNAGQGILDKDGVYWAQDCGGSRLGNLAGWSIKDERDWLMSNSFVAGSDFIPLPEFNEVTAPIIKRFLSRISALDITKARLIYKDLIGSEEEKEMKARALVRRAVALGGIYSVT